MKTHSERAGDGMQHKFPDHSKHVMQAPVEQLVKEVIMR